MFNFATLSELASLIFGGMIFWAIARAIRDFQNKDDATGHIHGHYVPEWIGVTYAVSGIVALVFFGAAPGITAPPSLFVATCSIPIALICGLIHGGARLKRLGNANEDWVLRSATHAKSVGFERPTENQAPDHASG